MPEPGQDWSKLSYIYRYPTENESATVRLTWQVRERDLWVWVAEHLGRRYSVGTVSRVGLEALRARAAQGGASPTQRLPTGETVPTAEVLEQYEGKRLTLRLLRVELPDMIIRNT